MAAGSSVRLVAELDEHCGRHCDEQSSSSPSYLILKCLILISGEA